MKVSRSLMGMPIEIEALNSSEKNIDKAFERLEEINSVYSPYISTSDLSRLWSGEIDLKHQSDEFKNIYKECIRYEKITKGYFSAFFEKRYNPTGYVKGWAASEAGKKLEQQAIYDYCVNLSGDMKLSSSGTKIWKISIKDPFKDKSQIAILAIKNGSIATSGNYERGNHIINPKNPELPSDLVSVSVVGEDIITADVLATALFVMGSKKAKMFINKFSGYEALFIKKDGRIEATSNLFVLI